MPLLTRKYTSLEVVDTILRGGIVVGANLNRRGTNNKIFGLHGLTLAFTTPAGTVTFDDPTGAGLTQLDIINQIKADVAAIHAKLVNGTLHIVDADVSGPIVLDGSSSTAAPALGLSSATTVSGTVYAAPGGTAPALVTVGPAAGNDGYLLVTDEA